MDRCDAWGGDLGGSVPGTGRWRGKEVQKDEKGTGAGRPYPPLQHGGIRLFLYRSQEFVYCIKV